MKTRNAEGKVICPLCGEPRGTPHNVDCECYGKTPHTRRGTGSPAFEHEAMLQRGRVADARFREAQAAKAIEVSAGDAVGLFPFLAAMMLGRRQRSA